MQGLFLRVLDFYNWTRVYVRYCDGSSYVGDREKPYVVRYHDVDPVLSSIHSVLFLLKMKRRDRFQFL